MNKIKILAFAAVVVVCVIAGAPKVEAKISINIGVAPACPYGYYAYAPYGCAPYGYYGPEWFHGSTFIGAGPWFQGSASFHGHVNNSFDPQHGYRGRMPNKGEKATRSAELPGSSKAMKFAMGAATQVKTAARAAGAARFSA